MAFEIGQIVNRIEDREQVSAVVVDVNSGPDGEDEIYLISYDEGGEGWWPAAQLTAD